MLTAAGNGIDLLYTLWNNTKCSPNVRCFCCSKLGQRGNS